MTAPDPIEFQGEWRQRPGGIRVPVVTGDTTPKIRVQSRPPAAQHPCQPGFRPRYRTTFCGCGCLLVAGEACPRCTA